MVWTGYGRGTSLQNKEFGSAYRRSGDPHNGTARILDGRMLLVLLPCTLVPARTETDYRRRVVHYRTPADAINACSLKNNCTDSNDGRSLETSLDSWLESELRRFHRGISLALLLVATVMLLAETVRHGEPRELALVGCLLVPVGIAETKLFAAFFTRQGSLPKC